MIRRPPRSTRTDTLFPTRRSADLKEWSEQWRALQYPGRRRVSVRCAAQWRPDQASSLFLLKVEFNFKVQKATPFVFVAVARDAATLAVGVIEDVQHPAPCAPNDRRRVLTSEERRVGAECVNTCSSRGSR